MIVRSQPLAGKTKRERQSNGDIPKATKCDIVTTSCAIPAQPQIYRYRFLDPQGLTVSGVVGSSAYGSFYLQAINLSNWPALSGLYDQYRIVCARFTFLPRTNVVSGTAYNPPLYTIIDYDDISAITFRSQMTERVNCCVVPVYKSHQRTFKPHIDYATYSGAFTSYGNLADQWIDVASSSVQHYGLKWFIDPCLTPAPVWDVSVEYYMEFRNVL